jgi:hypothetical protein
MATVSRLVLLLGAALFGGFVALSGAGFSRAVEPESYSTGTSVFWFIIGALFSFPFWLPALIPSAVCRWICATLLLFPSFLFGGSTWRNLRRALSNADFSGSVLLHMALVTVTCLICMAVLVWPEVWAYAKRSAGSSAAASEGRDGAA